MVYENRTYCIVNITTLPYADFEKIVAKTLDREPRFVKYDKTGDFAQLKWNGTRPTELTAKLTNLVLEKNRDNYLSDLKVSYAGMFHSGGIGQKTWDGTYVANFLDGTRQFKDGVEVK